jgi:hypothetical protein
MNVFGWDSKGAAEQMGHVGDLCEVVEEVMYGLLIPLIWKLHVEILCPLLLVNGCFHAACYRVGTRKYEIPA